MSVVAKQIKNLHLALCIVCIMAGGGVHAQAAPSATQQQAAHQVQAAARDREQQAREALAGQDLLITLSSRVNESNRRLQAAEERITSKLSQTTWLILGALCLTVFMSAMCAIGGFQFARYLVRRRERELIDAGKEPMAVLIHATRDHVMRLAQRLQMAGASETRLFHALYSALPALQVEAGKGSINLSKQIPKSEQQHLVGPVRPLDPKAPVRSDRIGTTPRREPGYSPEHLRVAQAGHGVPMSRVA